MLTRIRKLLAREWRLMTIDWKLPLVIFLFPMLFTFLFGSIYVEKKVTQVPTWIVDQDRSSLSRSLRDSIKFHEAFRVVHEGGTVDEFKEANRLDQAHACVVIPPHFERDLKHGRATSLVGIFDGTNFLVSNSAYRAVTEIGLGYSVGVQMKRLAMRGTPSGFAQGAALPIHPVSRIWYNPSFNYLNFLLPGLLCLVIQQVVVVGVALAFSREQEEGLFGEALRITDSPFELLTAKTLFYFLVNMIGAPGAFLVARSFGIDLKGLGLLLGVVLPLFLFAGVALGLCFSLFIPSQVTATQVLMILAAPSFLISGYTWPQMSMVPWVRFLSNLAPVTHLALPVRQIGMQGGNLSSVLPHLLWLWGMAAVGYSVAYVGLQAALSKPDTKTVPMLEATPC